MNALQRIINNLENINHTHIYVGIPYKDGYLTMIALTQQTGKHIEAKNYPNLVIPADRHAIAHNPSAIPGLYRRGHALGVNDPTQSSGFKVYYVLKKSVNIPPRPFLTFCEHHRGQEWANLFQKNVQKVVDGKISGRECINILGDRMQNDLKQTIHEYSRPRNAPLTQERKGFNDPLTDTGKLEKSVTWFTTKQ